MNELMEAEIEYDCKQTHKQTAEIESIVMYRDSERGHRKGNGEPEVSRVLERGCLGCLDTWFLRVAVGFSSYNGKFRLPLVLAQ